MAPCNSSRHYMSRPTVYACLRKALTCRWSLYYIHSNLSGSICCFEGSLLHPNGHKICHHWGCDPIAHARAPRHSLEHWLVDCQGKEHRIQPVHYHLPLGGTRPPPLSHACGPMRPHPRLSMAQSFPQPIRLTLAARAAEAVTTPAWEVLCSSSVPMTKRTSTCDETAGQ